MFIEPGCLEWWDTKEPEIQESTDVLVRPLAVARCDLDAALLAGEAPFRGKILHYLRNHLPEAVGQNGLFRRAPFNGPFAFGHEGVAEVVTIGHDVADIRVGDRVIVPFQISCGMCRNCLRGITNACLAVPPRSMYGFGTLGGPWGGFLSDLVRVPFADQMLVQLPDTLTPEMAASMSDNIPDAYRTVAPPLRANPGATVLVVGGGAHSVGLYAVGLAATLGASRIDYIDSDPSRCAIACGFGATVVASAPPKQAGRYAITVDASADPAGLHCAILSTESGGVCTSVGIYYQDAVTMPLLAMYGIGMSFVTGRANPRAHVCDCLEAARNGFNPQRVTTCTAPWQEAASALLDPGPKVVITRA